MCAAAPEPLSCSARAVAPGMDLQSIKSLGALGQESAWFENGGPYRAHMCTRVNTLKTGYLGVCLLGITKQGHFLQLSQEKGFATIIDFVKIPS